MNSTLIRTLRRGRVAQPLLVLATLAVAGCADAAPAAPRDRAFGPLADSTLAVYNALLPIPPLPPSAALSGGQGTTFDFTSEAFEQPAANLTSAELLVHEAGDEGFAEVFTPATGLGPHFNNPSCEGCHVGDGRGELPAPGQPLQTMLIRLSIPGTGTNGGPLDAPGFGGQLQTNGVAPVPAEARVVVSHLPVPGRYGDGTPFSLRQPVFTLTNPHRPLPPGLLLSPRVAPPNVGLGLLEAIPVSTIAALADEFDRNRDGISGRMNLVADAARGIATLGRFGVKANTPNLRQQSAGAYNGDMGITTTLFARENCEGVYAGCAPHAPEVTDAVLDAVTFYSQTLGVPARRNINDPQVRLGQALFAAIGCATCHVPRLQTGTLPGVPSVSNQAIQPYTDLLVHDMGPGLADGRPDFLATGREWRTAPLWGVGLAQTVNPGATFLHDGRARDLSEAILWHGGEGLVSREIFRLLPKGLRDALQRFLESL